LTNTTQKADETILANENVAIANIITDLSHPGENYG
jgi:hypothetical protein